MAQLSAEGWRHFQALNTLFENAQLKGQKPKATDIVNKGKPVLKQWQLKPLCSLSTQVQNFLLEKVSKLEMSLEEMKSAASEIKLLQSVQEAIVLFFKAETWEEFADEFGSEVSPEKLLRFAVKDFEQFHEFQKYLERLRRQRDSEGVQKVDGVVDGKNGAKGIIVFSQDFSMVEQAAVVKLPHFHGAFLAIGNAGNDCENVLDVISLISRLNFTKTTSFNLVLFTNVDDVKVVKEQMIEGGAADTQTAHFYVKNVPQRREKTGPYLREAVKTFVMGHWSVSRQVTTRHLSISSSPENLITVDYAPNQPLPEDSFSWLVEHLSREGDTVVDVNSKSGSAFVADLKGGRNAVWISSSSSEMQSEIKATVDSIFASDSDECDRTISAD